MAGTTPNIGLNVPDYGDHNWNVPVNQNWNTLDTAIAGKQATLTFDSAPASGSTNPVTSDGIYTGLNAKVDKADLSTVQCVVEYYVNGASWYRIWSADSNGKICIEQGGVIPASTTSITLLKEYKNTDYGVVMSGSDYGKADQTLGTKSKTVSSFTVETSSKARSWIAIGEGA